jgi:hypothetical protein
MKKRMLRVALLLGVLSATPLAARLQMPKGTLDLTPFVANAPLILHAEVVAVSPRPEVQWTRQTATARLRVVRWYRGNQGPEVNLLYVREALRMMGHNCIDFQKGQHWLVFAQPRGNAYELIHDCYGAVAVSSLIAAPQMALVPQLEADFIAGLDDPNPDARLWSIQCLGGLRQPSSRPALYRMMHSESEAEAEWAAYAALRTGDTSILPAVRLLLARTARAPTYCPLAAALANITDPAVIPELLLTADLVPSARRSAMQAVALMTKSSNCELNPESSDDAQLDQVRRCRVWWASEQGAR